MARNQAIQIENNFTKGLITENTALNFPENACTETLNCVFDETGRVTRRPGIDLETGYLFTGTTEVVYNGRGFSSYLWTNVAGEGTRSFLVQQQGTQLRIYDVSTDTTNPSRNLRSFGQVELASFAIPDSSVAYYEQPCQYAQGNGELLVTNAGCDPFYITYNVTTGNFITTRIRLLYRDFLGIEYTAPTLYTVNYRPLFATTADARANIDGARHFYNLINQGWWQGGASLNNPDPQSALGQWDASRPDLPSNADRVSSYRLSETDAFDPNRVQQNSPGNSPAPKGHFILEVGNADRRAALQAEGYLLNLNSTDDSTVPFGAGVTSGSNFLNVSRAFDGGFTSSAGISTSTINQTPFTSSFNITFNGTTRKDYGVTPRRIVTATVRNDLLYEFVSLNTAGGGSGAGSSFNTSITYTLYGSNAASAPSDTAGTILGTATRSLSITSTNDFLAVNGTNILGALPNANRPVLPTENTVIFSSDTSTSWRWVWVRAVVNVNGTTGLGTFSGVSSSMSFRYQNRIYEVTFRERITTTINGSLPAPDQTTARPLCVAFHASRAWYGGINASGLSNNIYFSQIVEKPSQYGLCYQSNDPTSEYFSDVLPTDGGVIRILEMGALQRMISYQNVLMLFATNGVWIIESNGEFSPTNFNVRKISSYGTQSPLSFVDVRGTPMWWGEDGILQIEYNPQFDSYSVKDVTKETIRSFYLAIPPDRRRYAQGAFDAQNDVVYWVYNTQNTDPFYWYDKVLCLNILSGAFYPWTIANKQSIRINGVVYIEDSIGTSPGLIKFPTTFTLTNAAQDVITFSDLISSPGVYADWSKTVAPAVGESLITDAQSFYQSYFITGYKIHGETMKFVQPNYLMIYLEQEENAGAFLQAVFDFTTSNATGKWSTAQQIYNSTLTDRSINYRRLKIRGKGRSIQYRVVSERGKPFTIIGWGGFETANAEL